LRYLNGLFVAAGEFGLLLTSADGLNWTQRNLHTSDTIGDVATDGVTFVAVAGRSILQAVPPFHLQQLGRSDLGALLSIEGAIYLPVTIRASDSPGNWISVGSVQPTNHIVLFQDTTATPASRLYRAVIQQ
jgi:hypothetical protein